MYLTLLVNSTALLATFKSLPQLHTISLFMTKVEQTTTITIGKSECTTAVLLERFQQTARRGHPLDLICITTPPQIQALVNSIPSSWTRRCTSSRVKTSRPR